MDEKNITPYRIALAGLLHDIGKFAQRAGWASGKHPEIGDQFVRQFVPKKWQRGLYPVLGHHTKPLRGYETKVVALADRLSAGEREPTEDAGPRQLRSIFCDLTAEEKRAPKEQYWPLRPLGIREDVLFPIDPIPESDVRQAYVDLWQKFEEEASILLNAHSSAEDLPAYLESMLLLLQRYTWCIPSAYYRALPDVSLYDHSRATAMLAVCLLGQEESTLDDLLTALSTWNTEHGQKKTAPPVLETEVALLVGGDISGVQDFIYTITSRGATSALRGRSFYLQLLTEAVARFVLQQAELPITNLIYQGGGHFYLLASPSDRKRLEEAKKKVSQVLLTHHRGDLYLALAWEPLRAIDFQGGRISKKWEILGSKLQEVKQHRFAELSSRMIQIFIPQGSGGAEEKQCQVCGQEHPNTRLYNNDVRKCPPCLSYEELGEDLRHAGYLWMIERKSMAKFDDTWSISPGGWKEVLAALGMDAGVVDDLHKIPNLSNGERRWILTLKDDAVGALQPDSHTVIGRRFLVNVTPTYRESDLKWMNQQRETLRRQLQAELPPEPLGRVKTFTWLEAQATGIKRLGVLRMDVDNLGTLFSSGLGERTSLSRVAALSFAVSLFFEGWVGKLAEKYGETRDGRQRLYSIYSGGDDLFFVGAWDAVVELARSIRSDLTRFTARHPGVHASAGIALVGDKYPLYQAAQDAGEAEEKAKRLHWLKNGRERWKDAVTFLGQVLPWQRFGIEPSGETEMDTVYRLAHRLVLGVLNEKVPRSVLRTLIRLQQQYEDVAVQRRRLGEEQNSSERNQVYYGPWMWRGYYTLKRSAHRLENKPPAHQLVNDLAEALSKEHFRAIEWIGLAARWAELLLRE